jgi:hypothetical protein
MKKLLLALFFMTLISCSKKMNFVKTIKITPDCTLGFLKYDKEMDLFYQPYLIQKNKATAIKNYDINNGFNSVYSDLKVSPNKSYFIIENIIKGYSDDGTEKKLHENYLCSIVSIKGDSIIVGSLQDRCDGYWNINNQFIFENEIVFDGKQ